MQNLTTTSNDAARDAGQLNVDMYGEVFRRGERGVRQVSRKVEFPEMLTTRFILAVSDARTFEREGGADDIRAIGFRQQADTHRAEIADLLGCEPAGVSHYMEQKKTTFVVE